MKFLLLSAAFYSLSCAAGAADIDFNLKPGFISGDDPRWEVLHAFLNKADVHVDLSWHGGVSFGKDSDMTLDQLRMKLAPVKRKIVASVRLAKNYTDSRLHQDVEKLLLELGFTHVLIVGDHSSGTYLQKYTKQVERGDADQPATAPESKLETEGEADSK